MSHFNAMDIERVRNAKEREMFSEQRAEVERREIGSNHVLLDIMNHLLTPVQSRRFLRFKVGLLLQTGRALLKRQRPND
jgi:hypothetical protein